MMLLHITKSVISENYPSIKKSPDNTFLNIYLFPNNNERNIHIIAVTVFFKLCIFFNV